MKIEFQLDGNPVQLDTDPLRRLLDVLRDDMHKASVKEGCGVGECGACAVLLNGALVNSCCVAVGAVAGSRVLTIDGFARTEQYRAIEQAFQEAGAVQCGFCTPGMVLAAYTLLTGNPNPTEDQIREAIAGNLCRCTGYSMIVDGIRLAAERRTTPW